MPFFPLFLGTFGRGSKVGYAILRRVWKRCFRNDTLQKMTLCSLHLRNRRDIGKKWGNRISCRFWSLLHLLPIFLVFAEFPSLSFCRWRRRRLQPYACGPGDDWTKNICSRHFMCICHEALQSRDAICFVLRDRRILEVQAACAVRFLALIFFDAGFLLVLLILQRAACITLPALQKAIVKYIFLICLAIWHWDMAGIFGEFAVSVSPET